MLSVRRAEFLYSPSKKPRLEPGAEDQIEPKPDLQGQEQEEEIENGDGVINPMSGEDEVVNPEETNLNCKIEDKETINMPLLDQLMSEDLVRKQNSEKQKVIMSVFTHIC